MYKIFIDGQEGTTGLKIFERFKDRNDFEILKIDGRDRKNLDKRLEYIEKADITFLCLPDDAAKEIVKLVPENAKIIDTSTAHRTDDKWVYGSEFLRATDIRHTLEDNAPVQKHLQVAGKAVFQIF